MVGGALLAYSYIDVSVVSRNKGQCTVKSAAYRSGELIFCEYTDCAYFYPRKAGEVLHTQIFLPLNAPERLCDRAMLWNEVEWIESKSNAQLAREIKLGLQRELSKEQQVAFAQEYCKALAAMGMCVDLCIHDRGLGNPHAHIMTTMRPFNPDGTWGMKSMEVFLRDEHGERIRLASGRYKSYKVRLTNWDDKKTLLKWRQLYEDIVNKHLELANVTARISVKSYREQGIEKEPMHHLGPYLHRQEMQGKCTWLGDINREIQARNQLRETFLRLFDEWVEEARARLSTEAEKQSLLQKSMAEWEKTSQVVLKNAALKRGEAEQVRFREEASRREKHTSKLPCGWKTKAKKDWQSVRQRRKPEQEKQVREAKRSEEEPSPSQQADILQDLEQAESREKHASVKPNGWKQQTQKDWHSVRQRQKLEQERVRQVASSAEKERVQQAESTDKHTLRTPNGWKKVHQKDWKAIRKLRSEQQELQKQRQVVTRVESTATSLHQQTSRREVETLQHRLLGAASILLAREMKQLKEKYQNTCGGMTQLDTQCETKRQEIVEARMERRKHVLAHEAERLADLIRRVEAAMEHSFPTIPSFIGEAIRDLQQREEHKQVAPSQRVEPAAHHERVARTQVKETKRKPVQGWKAARTGWSRPELREPLFGSRSRDFPRALWERQVYPSGNFKDGEYSLNRPDGEERGLWARPPSRSPRKETEPPPSAATPQRGGSP